MVSILRYRPRRAQLLPTACLALLAGIGLAGTGYGCWPGWLGISLLGCLWYSRRRTIQLLACVLILGLSLGWLRGGQYRRKLEGYQPLYYHTVSFTVEAADDGVYDKHSQMAFDAVKIRDAGGQPLAGKLQIAGFGLNAVFQGDELRVSGKLYPTLGAAQGRLSYAKLQLVRHQPSLVADVRRKFAAGMQNALPEPLASFAMGLLIGQRATLPADIKQDLLMVGLTHIIAVSGYNLTIMLRASKGIFGKRSKRLSTAFSLSLIGLFLLLAGSSASIIRAAIVSMLSIYSTYYGRQFKPLGLIGLAAAITAWLNPFYIWSDASWYLSFLAFFGVMILAPAIAVSWKPVWRHSIVAMVALESLCAEIVTLPFVLHTFGQMSFIGLPANVLVVTLVPLAMLLSLLAGLAGMSVSAVNGWAAWPARLLLTYMLDIAHMLARLPHIFMQNLELPLATMVGLYGVIIVMTIVFSRTAKRQKSGIITDKNVTGTKEKKLERSLQVVNN